MPDNYEIKGFLTGHRAEVVDMCLTEYNEAETMQMFLEEGIEKGLEKGKIEGKVLARFEDGMPIEDIASKTQLTVDFVKDTLKANGMLK